MTVAEKQIVLRTAANAYAHYNALARGFTVSDALTYALEEHEEQLLECSREDISSLTKELFRITG